jgi:hypothetical protein
MAWATDSGDRSSPMPDHPRPVALLDGHQPRCEPVVVGLDLVETAALGGAGPAHEAHPGGGGNAAAWAANRE